MDQNNIIKALQSLDKRIIDASRQFDEWSMIGEEYMEPDWIIESCFLQLLALSESLDLKGLYQMLLSEYSKVTTSKEGFSDAGTSSLNGEQYSKILSRIRCFKYALDGFFPDEPNITITKDILQLMHDIQYSITDPKVFNGTPKNENDVHLRIECILKCVFPDLKHKPTLSKQIKNFEPDTGIPSIHTLIEYKFLSRNGDAGIIADEILADTRGYTSTDWKRFIYIIYETNRFRKESEWNQLLRESGVPETTCVVVLNGEPLSITKQKKIKSTINTIMREDGTL